MLPWIYVTTQKTAMEKKYVGSKVQYLVICYGSRELIGKFMSPSASPNEFHFQPRLIGCNSIPDNSGLPTPTDFQGQ